MNNKEVKLESMRKSFGEKMVEISKKNLNVYALDGDLANSTKLDALEKENPHKFIQMGIAEQNMVGVSAGLASVGLQPWVVTFATFLTKRSLDQVQVTVAQAKSDVKMIGSYAGLLNGRAGKTHQSLEDFAIMRSLANVVIIAPADAVELKEAMTFANEYTGPVYIRLARDEVESIFTDAEHNSFNLGESKKMKEGNDVTVISTGTQTARSLQAAKNLESKGISVGVLHMPTIKPLDEKSIIEEAKHVGAIVTSEDHSIYGGLGSAVAEVLVENCPVPMLRVGVKDKNSQSGSNDELLDFYGLSSQHIERKIEKVLKLKKNEESKCEL